MVLGEDESTKKAKVLALAFNKLKQATPSKPKKERKEMADDSDNSSDNEEGKIIFNFKIQEQPDNFS